MTLFIRIPVDELETFSEKYLKETSEKIQDNPPINEAETHYLVGSGRLTQEQADGLVSRNPSVRITNSWPAGWVKKEKA